MEKGQTFLSTVCGYRDEHPSVRTLDGRPLDHSKISGIYVFLRRFVAVTEKDAVFAQFLEQCIAAKIEFENFSGLRHCYERVCVKRGVGKICFGFEFGDGALLLPVGRFQVFLFVSLGLPQVATPRQTMSGLQSHRLVFLFRVPPSD